MDEENFISQLIGEFPEIKDDILDEDNLGLISLQIISFKVFTQKAIDAEDLKLVKRCFLFVDRVFDAVSPSTNNSLVISYLVKLVFKENCQAINLLSFKLSKVIVEYNQAFYVGSENNKLNRFIRNFDLDQS
ncbi:DUF7674 family protein [Mucilaginibacter polytrichastri]|uniref:DUF7674 family protein n=1 Tax=Mucilaginibacter polytrichastri TaxID=1302689 RepID=UPI0008E9AF87|nr:hypothetical protein [Mucilaginibacter polytrichastri]SFS87253.1 hypothetical protein SAMN04487890_105157 [Mucilaginibacter polytrichastri]